VALSTDAPIQPLNPFLQIAGAIDHPVRSQRLTVYEALRAYTWAGAWSAFEEKERGTLAIGKFADFALLDEDPFVVPAERLPDVRATGTWHEGRRLSPPPQDILGFASRVLTTKRRPT
jgi:predicted amidohydrolase YtcJ